MKLPNYENAYIPPAKINGYLLSTTHSIGKAKARFFRDFGFDDLNAKALELGLLSIAANNDISQVTTTPFGTKFRIDGSMSTPVGIDINVRTVWIIEMGITTPRFVTAHPLPK